MADLDLILSKAQGLSYLGDGKWRAKCPVKGCKGESLLIRQFKITTLAEISRINIDGDFKCQSDCSMSEVLDAFDIGADSLFFKSWPFESNPEGYRCLLNREESLAILKHDLKEFQSLLERLPFTAINHQEVQKYWYLFSGIRWFLQEYVWMHELGDIGDSCKEAF
jgi:hypothetical protein